MSGLTSRASTPTGPRPRKKDEHSEDYRRHDERLEPSRKGEIGPAPYARFRGLEALPALPRQLNMRRGNTDSERAEQLRPQPSYAAWLAHSRAIRRICHQRARAHAASSRQTTAPDPKTTRHVVGDASTMRRAVSMSPRPKPTLIAGDHLARTLSMLLLRQNREE